MSRWISEVLHRPGYRRNGDMGHFKRSKSTFKKSKSLVFAGFTSWQMMDHNEWKSGCFFMNWYQITLSNILGIFFWNFKMKKKNIKRKIFIQNLIVYSQDEESIRRKTTNAQWIIEDISTLTASRISTIYLSYLKADNGNRGSFHLKDYEVYFS